MNIKNHLIMIIIVIFGWLLFYLIGLPFNYFLDWSNSEKMLLVLIGGFAILPVFTFIIIILLDGDYFLLSIWVAIYASAGLFIIDFIVVGLIQGYGLGFLISHWVLSIGYIEALIIMPLIGYSLKKFNEER
jgi:hypothetical protein